MSRYMSAKGKVNARRSTKNIQDVYFDHAFALKIVKKGFCRFGNGNFSPNIKIRSWRPAVINNGLIRYLVNNNLQKLFTTENITERLKVDDLTAFLHLKQSVYIWKFNSWQILHEFCTQYLL